MEVATIITSSKDTFSLFGKFIYNFPTLCLVGKDDDTAFYQSIIDGKDKIFYHFKLVNPEEEFNYNYSDEEILAINRFYGKKEFFMCDLSYRPESLLTEILTAFKEYIMTYNKELLFSILISHPFDGLKNLATEY